MPPSAPLLVRSPRGIRRDAGPNGRGARVPNARRLRWSDRFSAPPFSPHRIVSRMHPSTRTMHLIVRRTHLIVRGTHRIMRRMHRIVYRTHRIVRRPHRSVHTPHRSVRRPHRAMHLPHIPQSCCFISQHCFYVSAHGCSMAGGPSLRRIPRARAPHYTASRTSDTRNVPPPPGGRTPGFTVGNVNAPPPTESPPPCPASPAIRPPARCPPRSQRPRGNGPSAPPPPPSGLRWKTGSPH